MKISKKELFKFCDDNNDAINELQSQSDSTNFLLAVLIQQLKDSGVIDEISPEPKPQLKQLDQSDDTAKELLEVDLSSELTGSELCKAMLARGDEYVVCLVSNVADSHAVKNREHTTLIEQWVERDGFYNYRSQNWGHAVPANPATNEPLTASEAGF